MYFKNKLLLLSFIVVLGFLLRTIHLGNNPPALTWDEASWGYNAFSLGIDGKDEFGKFLPITYLESFGDYKPPVYAYLDILPVKVMGLNEFSTRLPSALAGTLAILLTYFLVLEIFGKERKNLGLLASFFLAISPWHILLSRAAFEANVANAFILLGILLFLKGLKKPYLLTFSAVSFVLAMNTFNSARIVAPILAIVLVFAFHKALLKNLKASAIAAIVGIVLIMPLLLFLTTPQAKLRFAEVNIFSDIGVINRTNQEIANDKMSLWSKAIHNRRFTYGVEYMRHYFDNLTPAFLFIKGDGNPKFSIQDVGQMYIWEIPFLIIGTLFLFRKREKYWWILPIWLLVGIVPAGFARETPHALRIESSLPTFQILSALGVISLLAGVSKNKRNILGFTVGIILFLNFIYFAQNYFIHYPQEYSGEWQYGYYESMNYVLSSQSNYPTVYFTEALGRPYIYYLFYSRLSPQQFRSNSKLYREVLGFVHVTSISNIHFADKISTLTDKNALYIATPGEEPKNSHVLKEFKLLNGTTALVAYTL